MLGKLEVEARDKGKGQVVFPEREQAKGQPSLHSLE